MDETKIGIMVLAVVAIVAILGTVLVFSAKAKVTGSYVWWDTYSRAEGSQYAQKQPDEMDRYGTASVRNAYQDYNAKLNENSANMETMIG